MTTTNAPSAVHPIVLFDGDCNLCNGTVKFVLRRDRRSVFRFAALQSAAGAAVLRAANAPAVLPDTLLLVENGRLYLRSTAALRIARHLRWPWPLFAVFLLVPRFLRDAVYRVVAANRYRWFGRSEHCMVPTPELRQRFLDAGERAAT